MAEENVPKGRLFSELYCNRGKALQDSEQFRRRIGYFCATQYRDYRDTLGGWLTQETGVIVPYGPGGYDLEKFFLEIDLVHVLDGITLVYRSLVEQENRANQHRRHILPAPATWLNFVGRALREQNIGYKVDDACGVHYFVDEEFERNRASTLGCLEAPHYAGVRAAFEDAHRHLDSVPADTKAAVRAVFESLEILARLMVPEQKNLNKWVVQNKLLPIATEVYKADAPAITAVVAALNSLAGWVDGMHIYRHGQGVPQPVAPPLDFAVYVVSSGASFLRWLIEIDRKRG